MQYTTLGASRLPISRIGFGCGDNAGLMVGDDRRLQDEAISRALEAGVSYFDTASKYGAGRSETALGQALRRVRADVVVGSKIELAPLSGSSVAESVRVQVDSSLRRLRRERIELYQLHDRIGDTGWSPPGSRRLSVSHILEPGGVGDALRTLQQEGKVAELGLTTFGGDPEAVAEVLDSGLFASVNASIHMLNPTALRAPNPRWTQLDYAGLAARAHGSGIAVLAIRGLGGGQLADLDETARSTIPDARWNSRIRQAVRDVHRAHPASPARMALGWVLAWPEVTSVVCGFSTPEHVDEAVRTAQARPLWTRRDAQRWADWICDTAEQ